MGVHSALFASAHLLLETDKSQLELGESLTVKLYGIGLQQSLDELDLKPLTQDFSIVSEYSATLIEDQRWPDEDVQFLRFKLYPKSTGTLSLPKLYLSNLHSEAMFIHVKQGMASGKAIAVEMQASTVSPWQQQQVIIKVTIRTPEIFATLETVQLPQSSTMDTVSLAVTSERKHEGAINVNELTIGWILYPLQHGAQTLELPPVNYSVSGRVVRRYFFPPLSLNVRELPPYIPPTMPVGTVNISSEFKAKGWQYPDEIQYWTVTLSGSTVPPFALPAILRHIKSNSAIQYYPASVTRTMDPDIAGIHGKVVYQIPFKALQSGLLSFPDIRFQYFDPDTGRLNNVSLITSKYWVVSKVFRILLGFGLLLILAFIARFLYLYVRQQYNVRASHMQAIQAMQQSADIISFRNAMKKFAQAEGWPANLTLTEWGRRWQDTFITNDTDNDLINTLSKLLYSNVTSHNSVQLCTDLYTSIKYAKRRTAWGIGKEISIS